MAEVKEVVRLYRRVLKLAARYPSIKRDAIIRDIKLEFREGQHLTDPTQIRAKVQAARQGIIELSQYTNLNQSAMTWSVDVGRDVASASASSSSMSGGTGGVSAKVVGGDNQ
ncbi:hypothetical protein PybrP1_009689 [[Pythium] brassicae (nom. inval.)]|nr:hypothetical protein PybrP1_009689 [[Pythium] brassicae (nom. inval.)]